jgi:hypothetical protein
MAERRFRKKEPADRGMAGSQRGRTVIRFLPQHGGCCNTTRKTLAMYESH